MINKARKIADILDTECLIVGGYVRDFIIGTESKDVDLEVYGKSYQEIVDALGPHFHCDLVGQSFGVIKIDNEIDVSIPRREIKIGIGHKGFEVMVDPTMTPREAAMRRDFAINSIAMNPITKELFDPFNGKADIEDKILRHTSDKFVEDPLRVLRGMQFAARFGFDFHPCTVTLCKTMVDEFDTLAVERVWGEWWKWATKGKFPKKGLDFLKDCGWLAKFPLLAAMDKSEQDPVWHPEGSVYSHTGYACDAAADICTQAQVDETTRAIVMFATLCHDIGKPNTQGLNDVGRITNMHHAEEGKDLTWEFMNSIGAPKSITEVVVPLVVEHMAAITRPDRPSFRVIRRLANRLHPANIKLWQYVTAADYNGRPPIPQLDYDDVNRQATKWVEVAEELALEDAKPNPILMGRHLIEQGMKPGPSMGILLKGAFEAQLDGRFEDLEGALEWAKTINDFVDQCKNDKME